MSVPWTYIRALIFADRGKAIDQDLVDIAAHLELARRGAHDDERQVALRVGVVGSLRGDIASDRGLDRQHDPIVRRPDRVFVQQRFAAARRLRPYIESGCRRRNSGAGVDRLYCVRPPEIGFRHLHGIARGVEHIAAQRLRIEREGPLILGQRIGGRLQAALAFAIWASVTSSLFLFRF